MKECPNEKAAGSKPDISLVAPDFILAVAEVMTNGRGTHGARQWEEGMAWSLAYNSLMRHMLAWASGEDKDQKSGYSHLAHAACRIMMLLCYEKRGLGTDDRAKRGKTTKDIILEALGERIDWSKDIEYFRSHRHYVALGRRHKIPADLRVGDLLVRWNGPGLFAHYKILGYEAKGLDIFGYYVRDPHDEMGTVFVPVDEFTQFKIIGYIRS